VVEAAPSPVQTVTQTELPEKKENEEGERWTHVPGPAYSSTVRHGGNQEDRFTLQVVGVTH
jgi:hypothetical protein